MKIVQVELQTKIEEGTASRICWLPVGAMVKPGTIISLKGDSSRILWTIAKVYETQIDMEQIKRGWNNNI